MAFVLASKSPRRRELLEKLGFRDFVIRPGREGAPPQGLPPGETVRQIALAKARSAADAAAPEDLVLAADTLVYLDGEALGKPEDPAAACAMLRRLSGKKHTVYTGVALLQNGRELSEFEASDVFFREMTEAEIRAYVATGEPLDKAGAYGIQAVGAVFVRRIEGDYFNVMGLPLCRLYTMLKEMGAALPGLGEGDVSCGTY